MTESFQYSLEELITMQHALQSKLQTDGEVINFNEGWLRLLWITDDIDPQLQRFAAKLIAYQLSKMDVEKPDRIIPVPMNGIPFATMVSEELRVNMRMARKGKHAQQSWEYPVIMADKPLSNGGMAHHAYNIVPGEKVILADDVLGDGTTIIPVIDSFREHGAIVNNVAVYAIKHYRPGYQRLLERGVQPIGALNIRGFTPQGKFDVASIAI